VIFDQQVAITLVPIHLLIHLSTHLSHHPRSRHPSLLHSFTPDSNLHFQQILPALDFFYLLDCFMIMGPDRTYHAQHSIFIARQHNDARYWYSNYVRPSVSLSVRRVPVLDENRLTYCHSFFAVRYHNHTSFISIKHFHDILTGSSPAGAINTGGI